MSAQTLVDKRFVSYWNLSGGRAVMVEEDGFTEAQGYNKDEVEDIRQMEVDEVIEFTRMSMLHKVWRVK